MLLGKVPRYLKWCISIYGTKKFYGFGPRLECTASIGSVYWQSFQGGIIGIFLKFNLDKKYHIIINFNHKMRVHQLNGFGTNYRYHIPFTKLSTVINIVVYFEHLAN